MNFELENPAVLGGLIVICLTLVRLVERLIDSVLTRRLNGKRSSIPAPPRGCAGLTEEEHRALMKLDDLHDKYDSDGTPLWYVPRSLAASMVKVTETLDRISVRLRDVVKTQESILNKMKRWEDSTNRIGIPYSR